LLLYISIKRATAFFLNLRNKISKLIYTFINFYISNGKKGADVVAWCNYQIKKREEKVSKDEIREIKTTKNLPVIKDFRYFLLLRGKQI